MTITFSIKEHGFYGKLMRAEMPFDKRKVVIVCGGNDGDFERTQLLCSFFTDHGIDALGLEYFGREGLPRHTIEVPVESAENAVKVLKQEGYSKIAIYGLSAGGEYALLAASLIPDITCVIAVSAPTAVSQADNRIYSKNTSSWSWRGKSFPFLKIEYNLWKIFSRSIGKGELHRSSFFEKGFARVSKEAWIPVENIKGPVLFLTAKDDSICPSFAFAQCAVRRLAENNFDYPKRHMAFSYASHMLLPFKNPQKVPLRIFQMERKFPSQCAKTRETVGKVMMEWIKAW